MSYVAPTARVYDAALVSDDALVFGNARVSDAAQVYGTASVSDDARVFGNALVSGNARVYGNALVSGTALVFGTASVSGNAHVYGNALVSDDAHVFGTALVYGNALVHGAASVGQQTDIAWVDRVGSGESMTLHRTVDGWQINAGCVSFLGTTVEEVTVQVLANITDIPKEWSGVDPDTVGRWRAQVRAALDYLAAMVEEVQA